MQFQNIIWYQNTFFCCQSTEPPELQMYSNSTISTWLLVNVTAVTKIVTRLKILCWSMSSKFEVGASWESAPSFTLFTFKLQADPTAPNSSSNLAWQTNKNHLNSFFVSLKTVFDRIFSNWLSNFLKLTANLSDSHSSKPISPNMLLVLWASFNMEELIPYY